jgi:hypothetical protein
MDFWLMRVRRTVRAVVCGLTALCGVAIPVCAGTPSIRDKSGRFEATLAPADGWCSSVVSVNLRAAREAFERAPEDVQRFIGAVRAGILDDCPAAEIIRVHGLGDGVGVFVAYTTKKSGWRIQVFPSVDRVLSMLDGRRSSAWGQELAYLETRTYFDRAKLPNVNLADGNSNAESSQVSWNIEGIEGATYISFDWQRRFSSLGDLADASTRLVAERCASEGGKIGNPSKREIAAGLRANTFECAGDKSHLYIGLVFAVTDNIECTLVLTSESKSAFSLMLDYLADKDVIN